MNLLLRWVARYAAAFLASWTYSFQTFSSGEVLGASKMNQIEVNIRDHIHGVSGVSGGTWEKLDSGTVAAAATLDISLVSYGSTYRSFMIRLENFNPATDDVELWVRTSTDGGSTFDAGGTDYSYAAQGLGSAAYTTVSAGDARIRIGSGGATAAIGNAANESISLDLILYDLSETTFNKKLIWNYAYNQASAGQANTGMGGGWRIATTDIDAIRFLFESGNIDEGKWGLYGMRF